MKIFKGPGGVEKRAGGRGILGVRRHAAGTAANMSWRCYCMAIDPVCKMTVDEKTAPAKSDYKGKTYYFCALGCKKAFDKDPQKYLK
jgi:YHS domain-containing protein